MSDETAPVREAGAGGDGQRVGSSMGSRPGPDGERKGTRRRRDPWDRFWEKVVEADDPSPNGMDGCWLWTAALTDSGYGVFQMGGRMQRAHRVAYEWIVGVIPDGLQIDHLCRRRHCVNPAHMEPVGSRDNTLRGDGPTARHARKTRCPAGHPLEGANLVPSLLKRGQRSCLVCETERSRRWRALNPNHREKRAADERARYERNRDKINAKRRAARARKAA